MMRLVVFDCDGTLVDSQHVITASMQTAFRMRGLPPPAAEAVKRIVGLSLPETIGHLYSEGDGEVIDELVAAYKQAFVDLRTHEELHEPLFPHVVETLCLLEEAGYMLGVATGKSRSGLQAVLQTHGLAKHFVTLQTADDAPGKPHPGMLERAMAETGVEKDETVLIGDTVFDMEMARNAGAGAFGVSWGYHEVDELRAAGAHVVMDHLSELHSLLAERQKVN